MNEKGMGREGKKGMMKGNEGKGTEMVNKSKNGSKRKKGMRKLEKMKGEQEKKEECERLNLRREGKGDGN